MSGDDVSWRTLSLSVQPKMERWSGRVAVVTGASAGIGAAIALELARKGMRVAGLARRAEKVKELSATLDGAPGELHAVACDLTNEDDIVAAFDWVNVHLGGVDVLVNNAGVLHVTMLSSGNADLWREIWHVNVLSLSICTKLALSSMKNRNVDDGHIIHVNSIGGHIFPEGAGAAMYMSSKHAVTALTEGLRRELVGNGSKIKVTSLSPGVVLTDMAKRLGPAKGLEAEDLATSVVFILGTPPHVQIHELMLRGVPEELPTKFFKPDFPLEYQREIVPEVRAEIPHENPPEESPRDSPAENAPENQPDEKLSEHPPESQPDDPQNPPESPPEAQPEQASREE